MATIALPSARIVRIVLAGALGGAISLGSLWPAPVNDQSSALGRLRPSGIEPERTGATILTDDHRSLIQWALDLYDRAGLDLGAVQVGVYDDPAVCGERRGYYRDGVVTVCAIHRNPSVQDSWRRHSLLHELAHAWTATWLDDDERQAFMRLRWAETWADRSAPWEERAAEHAAEIIAWAVADYPISPHIRLRDRSCAGFAAGFSALTGRPPMGGSTERCE